MPELFHHKTPAEEAELAQKGFVTLGANYGYARPLQITPDFTDDLDRHDLFDLWRPEHGRVAMIHGAQDQVIPLAEAKRFARQFHIPLTVVPGGDHRLSIPGAPQQVLACALDFFLGQA